MGRLIYWNACTSNPAPRVLADRQHLRLLLLLLLLLAAFFLGGMLGTLGFKLLGHVATVPLALLLVMLDDLNSRWFNPKNKP